MLSSLENQRRRGFSAGRKTAIHARKIARRGRPEPRKCENQPRREGQIVFAILNISHRGAYDRTNTILRPYGGDCQELAQPSGNQRSPRRPAILSKLRPHSLHKRSPFGRIRFDENTAENDGISRQQPVPLEARQLGQIKPTRRTRRFTLRNISAMDHHRFTAREAHNDK